MDTRLQLPSLSEPYTVNDDQVNEYRRNGHILLPGVASLQEVEAFRPLIQRAAYKHNTETRKLAERDTYGKAFLQITNLWEVDSDVRRFTLAKRFAGIARRLLGVKHVRIYHDQALYKEPGGGHTPWHQDQYYWPISTDNTVTMWMPLVDISEDTGMLTFASGSHKSGFIENIPISDKSEEVLQSYIDAKRYPIVRPKFMKAGDATWHAGWTLHAAPANSSLTVTREVMTIIYFADGATVTEPQNEHQEADRLRWLQALRPGEPAASELNPLL